MKALVDNLLRLNTEEGRLVIIETELEAFGCLLEQTEWQTDPTDCYNPLRMRWGLTTQLRPIQQWLLVQTRTHNSNFFNLLGIESLQNPRKFAVSPNTDLSVLQTCQGSPLWRREIESEKEGDCMKKREIARKRGRLPEKEGDCPKKREIAW